MSKQNLSTIEILAIRKLLPHNSINKIVKSTGVNRSSVYRILKGNWYNAKVLTAAIKIIEKEQLKKVQLYERIQKTVSTKDMKK